MHLFLDVCQKVEKGRSGTDADQDRQMCIRDRANGGLEIGNVVQDMFMANGKIYLLTQNGDRMGGAGRFVVCDARTLSLIHI